MSIHRKGYQFPDLNVPGDPRLLDSIQGRTPKAAGAAVHHLLGGTVITPKKSRSSSTELRFEFQGLRKKEGAWFVKIAVGCVIFNEIVEGSLFAAAGAKPKFCKTVFPTIDVDGDAVRIDDETNPMLALGAKTNGTVWLIVQNAKCQSESDIERLELTDRGQKPELEDGEVGVPIADFDVETSGEGEEETKKATNVYAFLQSDHQQPYLCDGDSDSGSGDDFDSSSFPEDESSDVGSESDSDSTPSEESQDSNSSDDDDDEEGCQVKARAWWVGLPTCLTAAEPKNKCVPRQLIVNVDVQFFRNMNPGFGFKDCTKWAYGVRLVGATKYPEPAAGESDEYVWADDSERLLTFLIKNPVPCGQYQMEWRVKSFPAPSGPLDGQPFVCCNKTWDGTEDVRDGAWNAPAKKLPKVCGTNCSSCSG